MSSGNLWLKYSQSDKKNSHAYLLNFYELGIGQWALSQWALVIANCPPAPPCPPCLPAPCPMPPAPHSLFPTFFIRNAAIGASGLRRSPFVTIEDGEIASNENFGKKYASQSAPSTFNGCYYVGTNCRKYHLE